MNILGVSCYYHDAAAALLSHAFRQEIDGAGTFVCETHCREVTGLLRDFFARVAA